jgi:hypothetical protein
MKKKLIEKHRRGRTKYFKRERKMEFSKRLKGEKKFIGVSEREKYGELDENKGYLLLLECDADIL